MSAAKTKAQGIIDENAVGMLYSSAIEVAIANPSVLAVFSKSTCPYCKAAKSLLSELGAKYYAIELDEVGRSTRRPT